MVVKKKSKVTKALIVVSFFITIIAIVPMVLSADPNRILMIDIMAKGDDADIAGATTSIVARIEFDKASGLPSVAQVNFQTKIYDESGEKIYSMKGKLKDGLVINDSFRFYCEVREHTWINLWQVIGEGLIKTTDTVIEDFLYRGKLITLPNTGGKYIPAFIMVMVSPKGEYIKGEDPVVHIWPQGGWATVIIIADEVGVVTYLTKYMEKLVP